MRPTVVEDLQAARKVVVRIVQARDDGAKLLPLVLALERLIADRQGLSDDLARILGEVA
ncbi:hypothetical protein [Palleronia sp.]|uniref:hypothetical protein n=1 Tax=Palleronia sp. TaxID=1940284 RepID=UPI0035C7EE1C